MFRSHQQAGTGAVCVETREETRLLRAIVAEFPPTTEIATVAAPGGALTDARTGAKIGPAGLPAAYNWAAEQGGRIVYVYDWHTLANNAGQWRTLAENLPAIRSPRSDADHGASLIIFVGPVWDLLPVNPLRGLLPILQFAPPTREQIRETIEQIAPATDLDVDALAGLSADAAEQAAAEVFARNGSYCPVMLRESKRAALRQAGLEIWDHAEELGGLTGLRTFVEAELVPFIRDPQLSVRRLLMSGVPGVGKSFCAKWLGYKINCDVARLSIPQLKAGIVGQSEGNLRRALSTIDTMAAESPLIVVFDELDKIASEGNDGGTSSGMFAEILTWLQDSKSQAIVIATLNHLDKLDAAMESRFRDRFFFDLPTITERAAVAEIHYRRLNCEEPGKAATATAEHTEGFSSREIAEHVCLSVARRTNRKPNAATIADVTKNTTPASKTQAEQLDQMRRVAVTLKRANDPATATATKARAVKTASA